MTKIVVNEGKMNTILKVSAKSSFRPNAKNLLLCAVLIDCNNKQQIAHCVWKLPIQSDTLDQSGLTVDLFLTGFFSGEAGNACAGKSFGKRLWESMFLQDPDMTKLWANACNSAHATGGLQFQIEVDRSAKYGSWPVAALPFELMADIRGFLFRKHGWEITRSVAGIPSKVPKFRPNGKVPDLVLGWSNVARFSENAYPNSDFTDYESPLIAPAFKEKLGNCVTIAHASKSTLTNAMKSVRPEILIWIGHGLNNGGGLVLHDQRNENFPMDFGCIVSSSDFANMAKTGAVDLAFIWSCRGAGVDNLLDIGVAEALLDPDYGDLTTVIASYCQIEVTALANFATDVIGAWLTGTSQRLSRAVATVRLDFSEQSLHWARAVQITREEYPLQS